MVSPSQYHKAPIGGYPKGGAVCSLLWGLRAPRNPICLGAHGSPGPPLGPPWVPPWIPWAPLGSTGVPLGSPGVPRGPQVKVR